MARDHWQIYDHGAKGANLVPVGENALRLEPMLSVDGTLRIALTAMQGGAMLGAPIQGAVTTPSGERIAFAGDDAVTIVNATVVEPGSYRIEGELAGEAFATRIATYRGATDLGTDVVAFLAPVPSLGAGASSEVFVYAFGEDGNTHTRVAITRRMSGMQHMTDDEEVVLTHTHFDAVVAAAGVAGFEPMGNQASVSFAMAGEWQLGVLLGSGMTESVVFDVDVAAE